MSQISSDNSLFLCGSNKKNSSCFLIYLFLEENDIKSNILVNSAYSHYKPILLLVKKDVKNIALVLSNGEICPFFLKKDIREI